MPLKLEIVEVRTAHVRASGELLLVIRLSEEAGKVFAKLTEENVGRKVRIKGGGHVNEPVVREPIRGGSLQIIGFSSSSELERTAAAIRQDGFIEVVADPR